MEFSSALGGKGNSINFEENTDLKCAVPKSHAYPATTDVYCEAKMPHLHMPRAHLSLKSHLKTLLKQLHGLLRALESRMWPRELDRQAVCTVICHQRLGSLFVYRVTLLFPAV